jgi:hypothetical protein
LRVDTAELRKAIAGEPEKKLLQLQAFVPAMLKHRNDVIREWMAQQSNLLKGSAPNIDEFVKRSNYLKETTRLLPRFRRKFQDIDHIRTIFYEFKFELKKEVITEI